MSHDSSCDADVEHNHATLARSLMDALRILFVCTGNLCRSPMAQAVGQNLVRSAGLARRVTQQDFAINDLILAMDAQHLDELRDVCEPEHLHKLRLFLDCAPGLEGRGVPDPYFGDLGGFDRMLDLCEHGVRGLLAYAPSLCSNTGGSGFKGSSAG